MMRQPDVSATQIAFVYAGDIWVAPKAGGEAVRLSSPRGEESFPKFSPDGATLAFSGNYDGNTDIYIMPVAGGLPQRITHHGAPDRVIDWYPDGKAILFATTMTSFKDRFNQLYQVSAEGGLPEKLPMPYGEFGAISPNGKSIAFTTDQRGFPDLETLPRRHEPGPVAVRSGNAQGAKPHAVHRRRIRPDVARATSSTSCRTATRTSASTSGRSTWGMTAPKQVTFFKDYDVHFPSIGPSDIVFENAGRLHLLDLKTEKTPRGGNLRHHGPLHAQAAPRKCLQPHPVGDDLALRQAGFVRGARRYLLRARRTRRGAQPHPQLRRGGALSDVVAGREIDRLLERSFGRIRTDRARRRTQSGNETEERMLTKLGPGFRYPPQWSPDSQKIVWIDQAMKIWVYDFETQDEPVD